MGFLFETLCIRDLRIYSAKNLCKIERLIMKYNESGASPSLRLPDLKLVITGGGISEKRDDGVLVIPIGCLKD